MDLIKLIAQHTEKNPDHVMLKLSDGSTFTYRELYTAIQSVRAWLFTKGVKGSIIILDAPSDFDHICCLIACISLGCRVLPFYKRLHDKEKKSIIKKVQPLIVLKERPEGRKMNNCFFETHAGHILHFTSGSYGAKKIVLRPYGNLVDEAISVATALRLTVDDVVLVTSPLAHSFGCGMLRAVLYVGATLALAPNLEINRKIVGIRRLLREDASIVTGVPYIYELLLRGSTRSPIRQGMRCYAGGAHLTRSLAERWEQIFNEPLRQEYGLGEGGITTFANQSDPPESIGSPIPNVRLKIIETDPSGVGELIVYRPDAPRRYLFNESPQTFQKDGGIRTGDLARADKNGRYYLVGRKKAIINVAGLKVNPREIELCLMQHNAVDEAVIMSMPDITTGERPVAFVKTSDKQLTGRACINFLSQYLSKHKIPKRVLLVTELPRTESGKIDQMRLTELL